MGALYCQCRRDQKQEMVVTAAVPALFNYYNSACHWTLKTSEINNKIRKNIIRKSTNINKHTCITQSSRLGLLDLEVTKHPLQKLV
jgi:hypothetical protein